MSKKSLKLILGILSLLSGIVWLFFDVPSLEAVALILGGIVFLIEISDIVAVKKPTGFFIIAFCIFLFIYSVARSLTLDDVWINTTTIPTSDSSLSVARDTLVSDQATRNTAQISTSTPAPSTIPLPTSDTKSQGTRAVPTVIRNITDEQRNLYATLTAMPIVAIPEFGSVFTINNYSSGLNNYILSVFCINCGSHNGLFKIYRSREELDYASEDWVHVGTYNSNNSTDYHILLPGYWYQVSLRDQPEGYAVSSEIFYCCSN